MRWFERGGTEAAPTRPTSNPVMWKLCRHGHLVKRDGFQHHHCVRCHGTVVGQYAANRWGDYPPSQVFHELDELENPKEWP